MRGGRETVHVEVFHFWALRVADLIFHSWVENGRWQLLAGEAEKCGLTVYKQKKPEALMNAL